MDPFDYALFRHVGHLTTNGVFRADAEEHPVACSSESLHNPPVLLAGAPSNASNASNAMTRERMNLRLHKHCFAQSSLDPH